VKKRNWKRKSGVGARNISMIGFSIAIQTWEESRKGQGQTGSPPRLNGDGRVVTGRTRDWGSVQGSVWVKRFFLYNHGNRKDKTLSTTKTSREHPSTTESVECLSKMRSCRVGTDCVRLKKRLGRGFSRSLLDRPLASRERNRGYHRPARYLQLFRLIPRQDARNFLHTITLGKFKFKRAAEKAQKGKRYVRF